MKGNFWIMDTPRQLDKPEAENRTKLLGAKIVVSGAVASIALWLIVLALGSPIRPFTNPAQSFAYALVVSAPALFLSIVALVKIEELRKR